MQHNDKHEAEDMVLAELAAFIDSRQGTITGHWAAAVRRDGELPASDELTYQQLVDHLPRLYNELCQFLATGEARDLQGEITRDAREHGRLRWRHGYRIDEVLREMEVLRRMITAATVRDFAPGAPAFRGPAELTAHQRIGEFFSLATADSVQQYMAEQQRRAAQDNAKLETGNQALSQANIHLQAADLTRQELTSTVAHELRNFLQGFNSALAVLEIDPSNQDALVTARRQTRDMEQLLEHLLAYSTLLDKHAAVTAQPFELQALHHELLQAYSPVAQGKGLVLEGSCDGAPTEVTTDRLKIKQIAANLLSNAIKYTPSGSVRLDFSAHDAQHWLLAVTDTGDGIGEEDQAHLFRRFERLSSHPDIPGSGLGLAVVKELVDLLEGQIQFSSTPGSGSRFQAIIPRVYRRET